MRASLIWKWCVAGHNTPEYADYLGILDFKKLFPWFAPPSGRGGRMSLNAFLASIFSPTQLSADILPMISTFYIRPGVQHSGFRIAPESHGPESDLQLLQNAMEIGESSGGNETQAVQYQ